MADIVNLRTVRKQRARAEAAHHAAEARVRHGRTRAQKASDQAETDRAAKRHANAQLDHPLPPGGGGTREAGG